MSGSPPGDEGEIGRMCAAWRPRRDGCRSREPDGGPWTSILPEAKIAVEEGVPVSVLAGSPLGVTPDHRGVHAGGEHRGRRSTSHRRGDPVPVPDTRRARRRQGGGVEAAAGRLQRRSRSTDRRTSLPGCRPGRTWPGEGNTSGRSHMMLLRSLMLARYGRRRMGHFGLALSGTPTSPRRSAGTPTWSCTAFSKAALGDRSYAPYLRIPRGQGAADSETTCPAGNGPRWTRSGRCRRGRRPCSWTGREGRIFEGTVSSLVPSVFFVGAVRLYGGRDGSTASTLRDDDYRFTRDRMSGSAPTGAGGSPWETGCACACGGRTRPGGDGFPFN
jgi:hypothetical protein